jgi:hypothetical protein
MYINVYLIDRAYGGPEEGGWYYTCGELIRTIPISCPRVKDRIFPRVEQVLDCWNRYRRSDIGSVLSEGKYVASVDRKPGKPFFPEERPYYE